MDMNYENLWKKDIALLVMGGTPVHAHCWTSIERIIGPRAEKELDQFLFALRFRFKCQPFEVKNCLVGTASKQTWEAGKIQSKRRVTLTDEERLVPVSDPINIPAIHKLIGESKKCRDCHLRIGQTRISRERHIPVIAHSRPTPLRLPLDIQFVVVDYLTQFPDLKNALIAFHWQLPESYWRLRIPRKLIFETEDLFSEDQADGVDWKYLCLGIERILATSHGLMNRKRIFRVLEGTRNLFVAMLEENGE